MELLCGPAHCHLRWLCSCSVSALLCPPNCQQLWLLLFGLGALSLVAASAWTQGRQQTHPCDLKMEPQDCMVASLLLCSPRPLGVRTVRLNVGVWHGNQQWRKVPAQGWCSRAGQAQITLQECLKRASFGHMVNSLTLLSPSYRALGVDLGSFPSQRRSASLSSHSSRAPLSCFLCRSEPTPR